MISNDNNLQSSNENQNLTDELDLSYHKYNLYQQFFIVGIDPKIMFNINNSDLKSIPEPYIYPKIISKYPNQNLSYLNIPDTIVASHCFPQGILPAIIDYDETTLKTKIQTQRDFVFSLDNHIPIDKTLSLKTNKVYYSCLLFYEDIEKYRECVNMKLNSDDKPIDIKNKNILVPKVIVLSSFFPFLEQSKIILESLKKYVDKWIYDPAKDEGDFNGH